MKESDINAGLHMAETNLIQLKKIKNKKERKKNNEEQEGSRCY